MKRVRWECPGCGNPYAIMPHKQPKTCPKCNWRYKKPPRQEAEQEPSAPVIPQFEPASIHALDARPQQIEAPVFSPEFAPHEKPFASHWKPSREKGRYDWVWVMFGLISALFALYVAVTIFDNQLSTKDKQKYLGDAAKNIVWFAKNLAIVVTVAILFSIPSITASKRSHPYQIPIIVLNASILVSMLLMFFPTRIFEVQSYEAFMEVVDDTMSLINIARPIDVAAFCAWAAILAWSTMPIQKINADVE